MDPHVVQMRVVLYEWTSWVEFIMFVFQTSRDRRGRPSRSGQTVPILKQPSLPEPALGPRKKAVFLHSFYPIPYYLGSHDDRHRLDAFSVGVGIVRAVVGRRR
jgi:hypothetical protein